MIIMKAVFRDHLGIGVSCCEADRIGAAIARSGRAGAAQSSEDVRLRRNDPLRDWRGLNNTLKTSTITQPHALTQPSQQVAAVWSSTTAATHYSGAVTALAAASGYLPSTQIQLVRDS